ncbi:TRAP transporter small permease [Paracraurococcus lichenis]|uniref:TRAP transporter small permease protein n=1 Tax=Paracraurococcus lichenis TaxID=3064888 RepID=A0ABT9E159_9PROT|nr:TRAP transporter small permease [Paracraurococcus sp. LOR1-02]MDO9709897.1 TRAP transporter small permease [Paracraurococcus sp. LOR1-02]
MDKPFEGIAGAEEAGFADDLRHFSLRGHGPEDWAGLALLWVLGILVFTQFFTRYALNDSVAWTEEVARYMLIVLTFVGSIGAVRRNTHIRVEALEQALPLPARRALWVLQDLIRLGFWAFGAWVGFDLADRMGVMPMDSLDASLAWVYWPVFLSFVGMTLREAWWIWRRWARGEGPAEQQVVA